MSIIKESENGIKCSTERMGNWVEMGWCRQQGSGNVDTKKKNKKKTLSHTHERDGAEVRATRKAEENGGIKLNYNKRRAKNELTTTTTANTTPSATTRCVVASTMKNAYINAIN